MVRSRLHTEEVSGGRRHSWGPVAHHGSSREISRRSGQEMMRQLVWSFYLPYCHAGRQNVVSPGVLRLCCAAEGWTMSGGLSWSPQQATDSGCDVVPDGAG